MKLFQNVYTSKYQLLYLKYVQCLSVNYTSIKQEKKTRVTIRFYGIIYTGYIAHDMHKLSLNSSCDIDHLHNLHYHHQYNHKTFIYTLVILIFLISVVHKLFLCTHLILTKHLDSKYRCYYYFTGSLVMCVGSKK